MTTLMVVDPGMMSGIFWGEFDRTTPLVRTSYAQIPEGLEGMIRFVSGAHPEVIVSEKFDPRPNGGRQFRTDELEPLRIEGFLRTAFGDRIVWQRPAAMVLRQGNSQAQRKKNSDDILRRNGWWLTGKDVGQPDANDANAAAKHALAYMRSIGHMPTLETHLRPEVDLNDLTAKEIS